LLSDADVANKVKAYIGRAEQLKQQLKPAPGCDTPAGTHLMTSDNQLGKFTELHARSSVCLPFKVRGHQN